MNPAVESLTPSLTLPPELDEEMARYFETVTIEDDAPVDNILCDKQQRLLTEPLYCSWPGPGDGRTFVAMANVGLFYSMEDPPLVPDALLSLDVRIKNLSERKNRSYFVWVMGKRPDVVIEVVSNKVGNEDRSKLIDYARIGVPYYVIHDPEGILGRGELRGFRLEGYRYAPASVEALPEIGLGLRIWEGEYEGSTARWLRWHDLAGQPIPTGKERADAADRRAERLEALLRQHGIEPPA